MNREKIELQESFLVIVPEALHQKPRPDYKTDPGIIGIKDSIVDRKPFTKIKHVS